MGEAASFRGSSLAVAGYIRVSTEEQGQSGLSVESQRTAIMNIAAAQFPGRAVSVFEDVATGRTDKRPGFRSLRGHIAAGVLRAIIVTDLDRLCRNLTDAVSLLDELQRRDVFLVAMGQGLDTGSPMGRLIALQLLSFAEFESRMISARTKRAQARARDLGKKGPGHRPFGWRVDGEGKLVVDMFEQAAIKVGLAARARGDSWRAIAALLESGGYKTVTGGAWTPEGCRAVLVAAANRIGAGSVVARES